MTTSEAVSFQAATSGALGEMYVSSVATDGTVTLTLAVGVESDYDYSITMSSDNGVTWTGTFSSNFGMTAGNFGRRGQLCQSDPEGWHLWSTAFECWQCSRSGPGQPGYEQRLSGVLRTGADCQHSELCGQ